MCYSHEILRVNTHFPIIGTGTFGRPPQLFYPFCDQVITTFLDENIPYYSTDVVQYFNFQVFVV